MAKDCAKRDGPGKKSGWGKNQTNEPILCFKVGSIASVRPFFFFPLVYMLSRSVNRVLFAT